MKEDRKTKPLNSVKKDASEIFSAGLQAVDSKVCMMKHINLSGDSLTTGKRSYNLNNFENIYVVGFGKASGFMAEALEELLMGRITSGIVTVRYGYAAPCKIVKVNEAGHPVPDEAGIKSTNEIINLLKRAGKNDLVFCLISGGGSALFESPCDGISLTDLQEITGLLLKSGAMIDEINAVRKHLSKVKGGRTARLCKGQIISLILSDVINDPPDAIASGPTSPDCSTFLDSEKVLLKYGLLQKIPASIKKHIRNGLQGKEEETPKETEKIFDKVHTVIIGNIREALLASFEKAVALGYHTLILSSCMKGEAREVARSFGAIAREVYHYGNPVGRPACILAGGETTVNVRGSGLGGRNQEFALSAAIEIDGLDNTVMLCAGTDGTDGNTDAAGAVADSTTVTRAKMQKIIPETYLHDNNSYPFFRTLEDLVVTGPTKTNVMDIMILLIA